ncbi:hypothetical protein BOX15_Mlig025164g1 [Macrostomum lignano]|uniref:Fibronectin type-III domain-containing protein n=1 Tax=Macrostomum lignano TaxID=282301 RepID=A0A267ELS6_9PLAT|nr:hypothetical protein BOX15_Mlig025164g1 [Macrostomum lignano]
MCTALGWPARPARCSSPCPAAVPGAAEYHCGGGKVKTLVVRWKKIPLAYQGGSNFTYDVQYRRVGDADWLEASRIVGKPMHIPPDHVETAIVLSGATNEISFKMFEARVRGASVKIETINNVETKTRLTGPWSDIIRLRSAEQVPVSAPINIRITPFNATAVDVFWEPPLNYDGIVGDILGYRIVYWPRIASACSVENNKYKVLLAQRQTTYGKATYGQVIGLEADSFYCFSVQLFNSAGDSPSPLGATSQPIRCGRQTCQPTWWCTALASTAASASPGTASGSSPMRRAWMDIWCATG